MRSTSEVLQDHLEKRDRGALDEDLKRNYAPDVVFICEHGVYHGRDAVRKSGRELEVQLGAGARFEYIVRHVVSGNAWMLWRAESPTARIEHGVDSFVIHDGRIVMQTVFYRLEATPHS